MEEQQNLSPQNPLIATPSSSSGEGEGFVMNDSELHEIEELIAYKFNDPRLLQQAFTHPSYKEASDESYERLEYIGDSVLNLLITREHYVAYPDLPPGKLTTLRAANVDTEKLARAAMKWNLHKYLRHRKPLLKGQIEEFSKAIVDYPTHSAGLVHSPKVLADIVESLVGAIYMDCNSSLETTWQQTGEIEVYVNGESVGRGKYTPKRLIAANRAAYDAWNQIFKNFSPATDM